jgi:hypothetical protein
MEIRAMDRRRYVPTPDGLEGRQLLSAFSNSNIMNDPAQQVPVTFRQKELRIEHLPYYLGQLQQGRFLPASTVQALQADLLQIAGELHKPNTKALLDFNQNMRLITAHPSLRASDIQLMSHDLQAALQTAGATDSEVNNLVGDMEALAKIDSQSRQPVYLGTNDYSLVLQEILGIGRPIQTPLNPQLAQADGVRVTANMGKTAKEHPRFVGTYGVGATVGPYAGSPVGGFNSAGDLIQIFDQQTGKVLGEAPVNPSNGDYVLTISQPMAPGVYRLRARAVDPQGHVSSPSEVYLLKVVARRGRDVVTGAAVPRGPLGLTNTSG